MSAYIKALSLLSAKPKPTAARSMIVGSAGAPPEVPPPPQLRLFVRLGTLMLQLGRNDAARGVFLQGCDTWQTCSMWLGAGIALLRTDQLKESEDALMEANVRNNKDPVVWGFVALVCLARGDKIRVDQADRAIVQANRLGLSDAALLRELANSYTALDLLESAEALFRRSLACESSAHTRRRLADVLSAQNSLAAAVNEYKAVIEANEDPQEMALAAGECEKLLVALGRSEEVPQLQALAATIQAC